MFYGYSSLTHDRWVEGHLNGPDRVLDRSVIAEIVIRAKTSGLVYLAEAYQAMIRLDSALE